METLLKVNYEDRIEYITVTSANMFGLQHFCEVLSRNKQVRSVEICTEDVEELELKTVGERIAGRSCLDVADVTLQDKKWNVRKRDMTH